MADCCEPCGCDQFFGPRYARAAAKRYRKRGLDTAARRMVAFLERGGLNGATVLEVGGGVGEIQIELLKHGAAQTVNLELVTAYEAEARRLLQDAGLQGPAHRWVQDIAV
jgi:cyclopropane fatty-acyl-phospholipid synthase-like methyltransferase